MGRSPRQVTPGAPAEPWQVTRRPCCVLPQLPVHWKLKKSLLRFKIYRQRFHRMLNNKYSESLQKLKKKHKIFIIPLRITGYWPVTNRSRTTAAGSRPSADWADRAAPGRASRAPGSPSRCGAGRGCTPGTPPRGSSYRWWRRGRSRATTDLELFTFHCTISLNLAIPITW